MKQMVVKKGVFQNYESGLWTSMAPCYVLSVFDLSNFHRRYGLFLKFEA